MQIVDDSEILDANSPEAAFKQSWKNAAEAFRNSPAGADWPGGEKNRELIGLEIAAMDAVHAQDKVAALGAAYRIVFSAFCPTSMRPTSAGRIPQEFAGV